MWWTVLVDYVFNDDNFPRLDGVLDEIAGQGHESSGCGFGFRDLQYLFEDGDKAKEAAKAMEQVPGVDSVTVGSDEE